MSQRGQGEVKITITLQEFSHLSELEAENERLREGPFAEFADADLEVYVKALEPLLNNARKCVITI